MKSCCQIQRWIYACAVLSVTWFVADSAAAAQTIASNDFELESQSDFEMKPSPLRPGYNLGGVAGDGSMTGIVISLPNFDDEGHFANLNTDHIGDPRRLGFETFWIDTRPPDTPGNLTLGMSSSHYIGVTDSPLFFDASKGADGQFFTLSNGGGLLRTIFETVDLSDYREVQLTLDLAANGGSLRWNRDDAISVYIETNLGRFTLFSKTHPQLDDDLLTDGGFLSYELSLPDQVASATLYFDVDSNAGSEFAAIDNIVFSGVPIPEPASTMLVLTGGLLMLRRQKRA